MRDYTHLYKEELPVQGPLDIGCDVFISAFNPTDRVTGIFDRIVASEKHWICHNEYGLINEQLPSGCFVSHSNDESEYTLKFFEERLASKDLSLVRVCVDATGFMRPHLMFLIRLLAAQGTRQIDILYSEPRYYREKERTRFSVEQINDVRQVAGFEGVVNNDDRHDLLIIGAGYETHLIQEVADEKEKAKKIILLGLPSLSADMYQQNAWRVRLAADSLGEKAIQKQFSSANDPFVTATKLSEIISRERRMGPVTNIFLSPLATKAQAVGFVLFYLTECLSSNVSILFPFGSSYHPITSDGLARTWRYTLEDYN